MFQVLLSVASSLYYMLRLVSVEYWDGLRIYVMIWLPLLSIICIKHDMSCIREYVLIFLLKWYAKSCKQVYSVEDKEELERFVTPPKVSVYYYDTAADGPSSPLVYSSKLQAIKSQVFISNFFNFVNIILCKLFVMNCYIFFAITQLQCVSTLVENISDMDSLISSKKMLQKLHTNLCLCVEKLGVWGACQVNYLILIFTAAFTT